jgi:hypothetical protein
MVAVDNKDALGMAETKWDGKMYRLALMISLILAAAVDAAQPMAFDLSIPGYADTADLTLATPIILRAIITKVQPLKPRDAGLAPAGTTRTLVTAQTIAALQAPAEIPATISYIWDSPIDARGKLPKTKGQVVLLFVRSVPGRSDQFQLQTASGQIAWSAAFEARVRQILLTNAAAPIIAGVGNAFRVAGAIPGEAESQFFLNSANPVSLVLLTRPGQPQKLSIALGDVIDEAAGSIQSETMLWYRLACFLPPTLPAGADDHKGIARDYLRVIELLGLCGRSRR